MQMLTAIIFKKNSTQNDSPPSPGFRCEFFKIWRKKLKIHQR